MNQEYSDKIILEPNIAPDFLDTNKVYGKFNSHVYHSSISISSSYFYSDILCKKEETKEND